MKSPSTQGSAKSPQPVVLLSTGGLGDAILFSPVFRAACAAFPEHERILVAATPLVAELYGGIPEIHRFLLADTNSLWRPSAWRAFLELRGLCAAKNGAAALVCASRISRRQTAFFQTICKPAMSAAMPEPPENMNDLEVNQAIAARILSGKPPPSPWAPMDTVALAAMQATIAPMLKHKDLSRAVAVYPSTPRQNRPQWPLPLLRDCATQLAKKLGGPIIVLGGNADHHLWHDACGTNPNILNLAGSLSLLQTAALFSRISLALCNDGALMHLAGAMNCPLVAILAGAQKKYRPPGSATCVVTPGNLACDPCVHGAATCGKQGTIMPYIQAITADQVLEAAQTALLNAAKPAPAPLQDP